MDIKEFYLNGGLTAVGDDAEFERKHPRKGGKFTKKGEGDEVSTKAEDLKKEIQHGKKWIADAKAGKFAVSKEFIKRNENYLEALEKLDDFLKQNGDEVKNGVDYSRRIEFLMKNRQLFEIDGFASVKADARIGKFGNFMLTPSKLNGAAANVAAHCETLGLGVKKTDKGNIQVFKKEESGVSAKQLLADAFASATFQSGGFSHEKTAGYFIANWDESPVSVVEGLIKRFEESDNPNKVWRDKMVTAVKAYVAERKAKAFAKKCGEMTDEELEQTIADKEALVKRYGEKDNPYAEELMIAESEMEKRIEAEAQKNSDLQLKHLPKKKGVDNSKMSDKGVRGLIEDGIAKANKGEGGLVVYGDCRVSVYSTSKGDCVSIAYLRDPDESVDDTNATIKSQYDRVAAFLKKNGFELQGDAQKFDKKYLNGLGDRPIELTSLGWVKKVEK